MIGYSFYSDTTEASDDEFTFTKTLCSTVCIIRAEGNYYPKKQIELSKHGVKQLIDALQSIHSEMKDE